MKEPFPFSSRFSFQEGENEFAAILSEYKKNRISYSDLTVSNPTQASFQYPVEAIRHSFGSADLITYHPDPRGNLDARKKIQEYYSSKGVKFDTDDLFLTSSSSEAYSFLFKLFCDPGDSILIPAPGYPLFEFLSVMEGLQTVPYFTKKDNGWKLKASDLDPKDLSKCKLILVVSPNNPTGSVFSESDFDSIKYILKNHNIPLIVDEVFSDYVYGEDLHKTLTDSDIPVIAVNGLSKTLGLPGMKLSWILLSGPEFWKQKAKEYLELISDTYLSVNAPVQSALSDLFQWKNLIQSQITKRIQRNLSFLRRMLSDVNISERIRCDFPNAGWYCVLESEEFFPEEEFSLRLLKEKKVYVHPGDMFGFPNERNLGRIVLSLLTETESFEIGLKEILPKVSL
ncbi:pyridoxal phosphate-dependent aminotransferase [Leptospira santarosai]|uniref:pyridoxal phosphate-dependent aminotransferase n=1 Tax=Leptospira santarosai TaxID=28183 RepID=UPI0007745A49|nr:pyridoxal phosphate-dependent aminotransferase [Leptospira santarosai]MDI7196103.1 pyridoxal phosphate-dependent aminotransferase [Leptospira santarosai]MDI7203063.1 pyridoxal phosphate-dependent aminotransferase [Leptospira santarosai]